MVKLSILAPDMIRNILGKIRSFEFNDWPQCPTFIRESILEVLGKSIRDAGVYDALAPHFIQLYQDADVKNVLEFGAGSGESTAIFMDAVLQAGQAPPRIYISDLYPMTTVMAQTCDRYPELLHPVKESVDVCHPPETPPHDMRMVLSAFHHFDRATARRFLLDAQQKGLTIFIAEPFTENLQAFLPLFLHGFISLARNGVLSPKSRFLKFVFTFLIPIIPLCLLWDGLISMMRMYTKEDFMDITESFPPTAPAYIWKHIQVPIPLGGTGSLLIGQPPHL